MHKEYLVVIEGKPKGPFSLIELKQLNIKPHTFVRRQGMDDFKEAHAVEELRELLGFSLHKTEPQYFAGFDQRLLATVTDHFIILGIYILLILTSFAFIKNTEERIAVFFTFLPGVFLAKVIYGIFAEASVRQATIGKRLLAIKVTGMYGERISLGRSFLRNFAKIFSIIPGFFGYLYCFFDKKNQTWHDIAANCLVIKDRLL